MVSMVGIHQAQYSVGDWIAMGGYLSTSVIGLSGMLVYGGTAAFSQIASTAHGADHVDVSTLSPELSTSAPLQTMNNGMKTTRPGGTSLDGAAYPTYKLAGQVQSALSEGVQYKETDMRALAATFAHSKSAKDSYDFTQAYAYGLGHNNIAGLTSQDTAGRSTDKGLDAALAYNNSKVTNDLHTLDHGHQWVQQYGVSAGLKLGVPMGEETGVKAEIGASAGGSFNYHQGENFNFVEGTNYSTAASAGASQRESASAGQAIAATLSRSDLDQMVRSDQWAHDHGFTDQQASELRNTAQSMLDTTKSFDEKHTAMQSFGGDLTIDERQLSGGLMNNSVALSHFVDAARSYGRQGDLDATYHRLERTGEYTDNNQRLAAAAARTLYQASMNGGPFQAEARDALLQGAGIMPSETTARGPDAGGMAAMQNGVGAAVAPTEARVQQAAQLGGEVTSSVPGRVTDKIANGGTFTAPAEAHKNDLGKVGNAQYLFGQGVDLQAAISGVGTPQTTPLPAAPTAPTR